MLPAPIRALSDAVAEAGGRALLVGGGVRDHLMGRPVEDWDVEVHRLDVEALESILARLGSVSLVGRSFGVFKLRPPRWTGPEIDVSIPRRDSKVGPGHRGIAVEGDPHLGVVEASRRRDLTVNAMMIDLATGELLDPWGGADDLARRRLRAVDPHTFLEDPLRAVRVVQFAARLEFEVEEDLVALCRRASLDELPAERILGEWAKLLLQARRPSLGLDVARRTDVLSRVFPEAAAHPGDDAVLDRVAAHRSRADPDGRALAWMLAAWLHAAPPPAVDATLDRLGLHRYLGFDARGLTASLVRHHRDPVDTDADLRWLSTRTEVEGALVLRAAMDGSDPTAALSRAAALGVLREAPSPLVLGRDLLRLGARPGPKLGRLLDAVYARQLDGAVTTRDEALAAARELVATGPPPTGCR